MILNPEYPTASVRHILYHTFLKFLDHCWGQSLSLQKNLASHHQVIHSFLSFQGSLKDKCFVIPKAAFPSIWKSLQNLLCPQRITLHVRKLGRKATKPCSCQENIEIFIQGQFSLLPYMLDFLESQGATLTMGSFKSYPVRDFVLCQRC